jgi:hypothetical protein
LGLVFVKYGRRIRRDSVEHVLKIIEQQCFSRRSIPALDGKMTDFSGAHGDVGELVGGQVFITEGSGDPVSVLFQG